MTKVALAVFSILYFFNLNAQPTPSDEAPRLMVGIVVDQMRYDYLTRFYDQYGDGGFKRLMNEGFEFKNNHFNYIPTYTGPGHASVYTGTYPAIHGIIANNWYDKESQKKVYCVEDNTVTSVGTENKTGKMSPHRMITSTITDQLKLHTQGRSKVIGIALKDRGAILPVGHSADAAYWFHGKKEGKWISSSFYFDKLPQWVEKFNTSGVVPSYLNENWETLYPINTYTDSYDDNNSFEKKFAGKETPTFPYDIKELAKKNGGFDILKETPFGNNITTDFAIAAIEGESLGKDKVTDFLAISYSSPDYIGHTFGVHSKEVQDNYLRLDQDIERLLNYLDNNVGVGQYTIFLTADHGAVHNPAYLQSHKIPAGFMDNNQFKEDLKTFTKERLGSEEVIQDVSNGQVFLNKNALRIDAETAQKSIAEFLLEQPFIEKVFTRTQLENNTYVKDLGHLIQNGFNQKRSGDVMYIVQPAVLSTWYKSGGTTHGSGYTYDTHVPLIFFGKGIKKGKSYTKSEITDIAPTLSALLGIARPNGATGNILSKVFD